MKNKLSVFIFRNDIRLEDNTALIEALKNSKLVIPIFIFNKKQIGVENEYRSLNAMQFMRDSLLDLNAKLKSLGSQLYMFYDDIEVVLLKLLNFYSIEAVFLNEDYTPFSISRDKNIKNFCLNNNLQFFSFKDKVLNHPLKTVKLDKKPYTVFTSFYKKNSFYEVDLPKKNNFTNYFNEDIHFSISSFPLEFDDCKNENIAFKGGRNYGLHILNNISNYSNYDTQRDFPILNKTTHLSAYLRFGVVSPREVYWSVKEVLGESHSLIRQLYWRDFFYSIVYFFPHVFKGPFNKKYDSLQWENDSKKFEAWCLGKTGFPLIDAAMRELNITGYMHNRVRMLVSSFLIKSLHVDWRLGEKYFASKLIDYDPSLNNGNWQWASSTGCDAQPYFRVFNPWIQQIKFDEDCLYIKKWVFELKNLSPKAIHSMDKIYPLFIDYPKKIVDHKAESLLTKEIYSKCK